MGRGYSKRRFLKRVVLNGRWAAVAYAQCPGVGPCTATIQLFDLEAGTSRHVARLPADITDLELSSGGGVAAIFREGAEDTGRVVRWDDAGRMQLDDDAYKGSLALGSRLYWLAPDGAHTTELGAVAPVPVREVASHPSRRRPAPCFSRGRTTVALNTQIRVFRSRSRFGIHACSLRSGRTAFLGEYTGGTSSGGGRFQRPFSLSGSYLAWQTYDCDRVGCFAYRLWRLVPGEGSPESRSLPKDADVRKLIVGPSGWVAWLDGSTLRLWRGGDDERVHDSQAPWDIALARRTLFWQSSDGVRAQRID